MSSLSFVFQLLIARSISTSDVVVFPNGSISAVSFDFNSTAKYATSKSFGVEIITSPKAISRCISWLFYSNPLPDIDKIKNEFWKYSTNQIVSQINVSTPIYVSDGVSEGRNKKRMVWFENIKTNVNPTWDILCSSSTVN